MLLSFEAILKRFSLGINFKSQFQSNDLPLALKYMKIASKHTSIVTILASITLAGCRIFQVLSIDTILASIEQVNTPKDCGQSYMHLPLLEY